MINFRTIFNNNYSVLGILIILFVILLILLINQDSRTSLKLIGTPCIISGIIALFIDFILYLIINIIPHQYKIFIEVISNNIIKNIIYASIISITVGIILIVLSRKNVIEENS